MAAYAAIVPAMKETPSRKARPATSPRVEEAQAFYRGDDYHIEESVGHMVRLLINSLNRSIDAEMQPHDLTAMQWKPLLMIKLGRGDTAAELARQNCSDTGAMTRMLDRLEGKGLLQRTRSELDRRVVHLELTPEGERAANVIPYGLSNVLNTHLAGFSASEVVQLKSMLRRMIANGERAAGETKSDEGFLP